MKAIRIIACHSGAGDRMPCASALADHDGAHTAPAATLLYLDQQGWKQASGEAKAALAADFMRVFCGNPAMPAVNSSIASIGPGTPAQSSSTHWLASPLCRPIDKSATNRRCAIL